MSGGLRILGYLCLFINVYFGAAALLASAIAGALLNFGFGFWIFSILVKEELPGQAGGDTYRDG